MSPVAILRHRRAAARHAEAVRTAAWLADTAAELRGRAVPFLAVGRLDLATPYLDEAEALAEIAGEHAAGL